MKSFSTVKKQLLKDKEVRAAYEALEPEYALARLIIKKRLQKGLTQAALARRVGTKQSAIARLESGDCNPTINFLARIAKALNTRLIVSLSIR